MNKPIETPAIILSSADLNESDKLLTFYTQNGKERAIAKGAKRSQKRFLNALEPFTYLNLQIVPHRLSGLGRIESADVRHSFDAIRFHAQHFMFATLACELIDKWTKEGDPCQRIFQLLLWLLHKLHAYATSAKQHSAIQAKTAMVFFQIKLLQFTGYGLDWSRCRVCNRTIQGGRLLQVSEKGIICEACDTDSLTADTIHTCAGVIKAIQYLQDRELHEIQRLTLSDRMWAEIWDVLERLHKRHISRLSSVKLNSYDIIRTQTTLSGKMAQQPNNSASFQRNQAA